jgi:hypothetical protein
MLTVACFDVPSGHFSSTSCDPAAIGCSLSGGYPKSRPPMTILHVSSGVLSSELSSAGAPAPSLLRAARQSSRADRAAPRRSQPDRPRRFQRDLDALEAAEIFLPPSHTSKGYVPLNSTPIPTGSASSLTNATPFYLAGALSTGSRAC